MRPKGVDASTGAIYYYVACEKMQLVVTRNLAVNIWIALAQDLLTSPAVEVISIRSLYSLRHITTSTDLSCLPSQ